jgi:hypothetical protein
VKQSVIAIKQWIASLFLLMVALLAFEHSFLNFEKNCLISFFFNTFAKKLDMVGIKDLK